jgi:DNA mismatch endonuclease (patch repair protein)
LALRRVLHGLGLRYLVHRRPLPGLRRSADVVFPRARVAVFVDGCFWHGCPEHGCRPKVNDWYWQPKLASNQQRDADTNRQLEAAGWAVVRIWEHEDPQVAAQRVEALVRIRARHRSR